MSRQVGHRLGLGPDLRGLSGHAVAILVACATAPEGATLEDVQQMLLATEDMHPMATRRIVGILWGDGLLELRGVVVTARGWLALVESWKGEAA